MVVELPIEAGVAFQVAVVPAVEVLAGLAQNSTSSPNCSPFNPFHPYRLHWQRWAWSASAMDTTLRTAHFSRALQRPEDTALTWCGTAVGPSGVIRCPLGCFNARSQGPPCARRMLGGLVLNTTEYRLASSRAEASLACSYWDAGMGSRDSTLPSVLPDTLYGSAQRPSPTTAASIRPVYGPHNMRSRVDLTAIRSVGVPQVEDRLSCEDKAGSPG